MRACAQLRERPAEAVLSDLAAERVAVHAEQIRRLVRSRKGVSRLNKGTGAFFVGAGGLMLGVNQH